MSSYDDAETLTEVERVERENQACEAQDRLLSGSLADEFAIALDLCGWKIVPKNPEPGQTQRWFLNKPSADCPAWADNGVPSDRPKNMEPLH
jgi:hypothetical protein